MKKLLLMLIAIVSVAPQLSAQWKLTNVPASKIIVALAVSGSKVFAASGEGTDGIYLSTDNGGTWAQVTGLPINLTIYSLAISGSNTFAGTNKGVYLSTDNGNTWNAVNTGIPDTTISSLTVSGSNIFAGTEFNGIYLSSDNGNSWNAINTGMPTHTTVQSIAISGSNIWAGTHGDGIYLSTNNGSNWTAMNNGIDIKSGSYLFIPSIGISGSNIFLGIYYEGVLLSTNNGSTWSQAQVNTGLPNPLTITSIVISGTHVFAGTADSYDSPIYMSNDNGNTWTSVNTGLNKVGVMQLAISGTNLIAGTSGGVWIRPLSEMSAITGINEMSSQNSPEIFPNPSHGIFNIKNINSGRYTIQLFDVTGKSMLNQSIVSGQTSFDASGLNDGIYNVSIINNDCVTNRRLVICK